MLTGLQTDDHSLCVRQVFPKAAAMASPETLAGAAPGAAGSAGAVAACGVDVDHHHHHPLRRSLQELNELCRSVKRSHCSTPAADQSPPDGTSRKRIFHSEFGLHWLPLRCCKYRRILRRQSLQCSWTSCLELSDFGQLDLSYSRFTQSMKTFLSA